MPQKACEKYIFHVMAYAIFFEMPHFIFGSFSLLKLITCILFEMPRFLMFIFFEMPHFSYLILKMGKMGHLKKMHVINFKR